MSGILVAIFDMINVFITLIFVGSVYSSNWESKSGNGTDGKVLANLYGSFLPPVSKITLPKLPAIPRRNTVTLTTTVLTQETRYVPVQPTCLKLIDIKSVCDGYLETIIPTLTSELKKSKREINIQPTVTQMIQTTIATDSARMNIVDPFELDPSYSYEKSNVITSTPLIDFGEYKPSGNFLEYLLGPKFEFSTEYLAITKVVKYSDYLNTVTLIAKNCAPSNMHFPACGNNLNNHPYPIKNSKQNTNENKIKETTNRTVDKVYDVMNKFVITNPFSFLGISPEYSESKRNAESISLIEKTAKSFILSERLRDNDN